MSLQCSLSAQTLTFETIWPQLQSSVFLRSDAHYLKQLLLLSCLNLSGGTMSALSINVSFSASSTVLISI